MFGSYLLWSANNPLRYVDPSGNSLDFVKKGYEFMEKVFVKFPGFISNGKACLTGYGKRIPDFINNVVIGEIKNVKYQCLTKQIKGFLEIAKNENKTFVLVISEGTKLSKPLIDAIADAGGKIIEVGNDGIKSFLVPFVISKEYMDMYLKSIEQKFTNSKEVTY